MRARAVVGVVVALLVVALWVAGCSGPRPSVVAVRGQPATDPAEPYRVAVVLRNAGWGEGEVQITVRLRDTASGQTRQFQQPVTLERGETTQVDVAFTVPPGDYEPEAEVEYPPR